MNDLLRKGYSIQPLSDAEALKLVGAGLAAMKFFAAPQRMKETEVYPLQHLGYRPVGGEYVGNANYWDINESLSYSRMASHLIVPGSLAQPFYEAASQLFDVFDSIVQSALVRIVKHYGSDITVPDTAAASWIQVNFYQKAIADGANRDLMQGRHQDGHLITVWNSQDPGMEYFVVNDRETTEPLTLATTQVLLMPGDLLTRITGGDIKPMFHQVRRIESVYARLAIMYFSNPDPGKPVYPCSPRAERVDLSRLIREERLLIRPGAPGVTAMTTRTVPAGTPAEAET